MFYNSFKRIFNYFKIIEIEKYKSKLKVEI